MLPSLEVTTYLEPSITHVSAPGTTNVHGASAYPMRSLPRASWSWPVSTRSQIEGDPAFDDLRSLSAGQEPIPYL